MGARRACGVLVVAAMSACSPRTIPGPAPTDVVSAPEWEAVFTRTQGWTGADGAATVALPDGRVLWLFGDTFVGPVYEGRHADGTVMVNNTIAMSAVGSEPPRSISFYWGGWPNKPIAWAVPSQRHEWFWPTGGGLVAPGPNGRDRLVLFMSRIARIDNSQSVWNFRARGSTALVIDNPEDDAEEWKPSQTTLTTLPEAKGSRLIMWGCGAVCLPRTAQVLVLGIDETNVMDKRLVMARAPTASVERFEKWEFRATAGWSRQESDASAVADGLSSEVSLHRMDLNGRDCLVLVYSEALLGSGIMARTCTFPDGAWSAAAKLYDCPEPAQDRRLMAYSAKAHPELSGPSELLISYSVNSTDFADVLAHAEKYRPRFVRVPIRMLPAAP
jgi:hypothetical protein